MRIGDLLARQVAARPGGVAVIEDGRSVAWAELAERVAGFAAHLAELGVERGGRVAIWLPNGVDYVVAILAVARRRALTVHVNTRFGAHEVGDLVERTRPTVLVTRTGFAAVDFAAMLRTIPAEKLASVRTVIRTELPLGDARQPASADGSSPEDDALLFTTGGTTAKPKLVLHKQRSITHHAHVFAIRTGMVEADAALLAAVPFCGTFGNVALMGAIAGGATIVAMSAFDEHVADALTRQHRITHLIGDDKMIGRLAAVAVTKAPHTTVRFFGVAGFHPGAADAFARGAAVGLRPVAVYGSSEVQALQALGDPAREGLGAVTPVDDASIVRVEDDELRIGGPALFDRYLDDPAATERAMAGGLFHTGDRARFEDGGPAFHFDGRMGDTLRLGGFLVSPAEIEDFLQGRGGVAQAQVVGAPHEGRIAAFAFVIAAPGEAVDEPALLAACRAQLARYKVPARIVAIDEFPTSNGPNGPKISRAELRVRAGSLLKGGPS